MPVRNENRGENRQRLLEIMEVMRRHEIVKGITPEKLCAIIEELGPTFIKLGQILSMRSDILPAAYCDALKKLRSSVAPMPYEQIAAIVEKSYGRPLEEVFASFDHAALGSASIAQAHAAVLQTGEPVVVKVQRPHIYAQMERDITLLRRASKLLNLSELLGSVIDVDILLDEFWETAKQEMDFINEAAFMQRFAKLNGEVRYIAQPSVHRELTTSRVLVMEYIGGCEIDDLECLEENGYDRREIAAKLADHYMKQIIDDGFFHADPHPGNLRVRDGKIVWLDFGMMGQLGDREQSLIRRAFAAMAAENITELTDVILTLGVHDGQVDYHRLYDDMEKLMGAYMTKSLSQINLGEAVQDIFTVAHRHHISMPKGISMLARGLVSAESTVAMLDPDANIITTAIRHMGSGGFPGWRDAGEKGQRWVKEAASLLAQSARIPAELSSALHQINKGRLKVNLEVMDSFQPLSLIDKMVNKLIVCIVAAALLIGSSLICTTEMTPRIFGIPALGFMGYIAAVLLGVWMLFHTHVKR